MLDDYLKMILKAPVYDIARETPLDYAPELSRRIDNEVWLKREDTQPVFSYKIRGAYNLMVQLSPEQRRAGVITASAGNHAQGVAMAAAKLDLSATIVMPKTTPDIKVAAVRRLGAEILLHGNTYDEASDYADTLASQSHLTYVPPYDHPLVIAGQGTVGMEILRQHLGQIDAIFVPIGGGGLIAGIGAYVKALEPNIRIIGVEAVDAASMHAALELGERVVLEHVGIFADGAAVRQVGVETFRLAQQCVDEVLTVSIDEICAAVKDTFEDTRAIAEPAGALALAGLKQWVKNNDVKGKHLVAIFSGANVNFDRLRHIAELAALGEQREALIAAKIPERPGSFRKFCHALGARAITEFNYRYSDTEKAVVFTGIQLRHGDDEKIKILANLAHKGFEVLDISANELAKMHVRYMVGGRAGITDERILRFEFPERPGALLHFLNLIGERWNISLFHYRNHGAAYGRVLMGIQVPGTDHVEFDQFLTELNMEFVEEHNNPAYELFLA
ncbi:MAG: threonine ammonia-lyase, biosynthetic [Gammaproteobacteria bacterium]